MKQQTNALTPQRTWPTASPASGVLQRKCACGQHTIAGGEYAECRRKRLSLQRRATDQDVSSTVPPIVHDVLRSPGQPLDPATRAFMESRFGHDFSRVRVHSAAPAIARDKLTVSQTGDAHEQEADRISEAVLRGQTPIILPSPATEPSNSQASFGPDFSHVRIRTDTRAAESARAVNARAYTVGHDVVFGYGQYAPATTAGKRLLAHELTHTLQRTGQIARQPEAPTTPEVETPETLARKMREAFRGLGTNEAEVYRILSMPALTVQAVKTFYDANLNDHTGKGLIEDIKDEFSGSELGRAMILLSNAGIAVEDFQADTPEALARKIREAFRGIGTDEDEVYRILSYPPDQVRAMINYYNDNLNDHTGKGLVEDIKDEFSGSELDEAMRLLANAKIAEHTVERTTRIESTVPGEPDKLWAGLIVRGMWSKEHEPGVQEQHADVVIPDTSGAMRTRGFFGDQPGATGSSAGLRASIGMGISGISADMDWFLANRTEYVDLELAKLMSVRSSLILVKVTRAQAAELDRYWEDLKSDPGTFYILGHNCSTAAAAGFEEAHLAKEITGLDTPDNLFQQLRARYRDAFLISGFYGYTRPGRRWELVDGRPDLKDPGTGSWDGPFVVEQRLV